jgi:Endo-alpha-N-acetylgalactosaminidase
MSIDTEQWRNISGEKYDWKETKKPETPYNYPYHETLTMKLAMAIPDNKGNSQVAYTFETALELIKKVDFITLGIQKIIYLVGWQYLGHDDRYPAFFEVNEKLKRPSDKSARDSIIWFAQESKKYNTIVSLHINFTDAYKVSPLWDEYVKNDLISKKKNGKLKKIGTWNGRDAYQVCYKNEWESGFFVKRIEKLLDLLPFLRDAKTIHADAFFARTSPFHNITIEEEESYMRKIYRYFASIGLDITSEFFKSHRKNEQFIGLQPMVWWFDQSANGYLEMPANLICGGKANPDLLIVGNKQAEAGFMFGQNAQGEGCFSTRDPDTRALISNNNWENEFKAEFFLNFPQFYYLNQFKRLKISGRFKNKSAYFSDDLIVSLKERKIVHKDCLLREKNNIFIPILWTKTPMIVAYSENGYKNREWTIPPNFSNFKSASIQEITSEHLIMINEEKKIDNSTICLSLKKNQAVIITPK